MNGIASITVVRAALASRLSQLGFASGFTALGAEGILSLSAQSTTDRVLDMATGFAIYAAALFVVTITVLSLWSTLTSPRTAIGRLLTSFRIDHLYMDVGLFWNKRSGSASKAFLRSLSPKRAVVVANQGEAISPPSYGQQAEIEIPGVNGPINGRIVKSAPVEGLSGSYTLEILFDELADDSKASLLSFIAELRKPVRI